MTASSPERWQRIEAALTPALEVEASRRAAILDQLCAADAALRSEVESLLAAHARAGEFLTSSAGEFAAPFIAELSDQAGPRDGAGSLIGRYRLLEEIGHGGMGTVWLAERADGHFEQRVALKLIKRGMDSEEILARFMRERQILARLEHPDIARLLDGGITDDGRPYFVMEHVRGVPLTQWCDERSSPIEERLHLFATVCHAVQYAHRNLVVHRDIKPSNVLVTDSGAVKLLDFGVAKLLSDDVSGESTVTAFASSGPMTPEYASPEQLAGEPVTTASDVYQLGVLLYELLAGHRPYRLAGLDRRERERLVCEVEPPRPSTAARAVERLTHRDGSAETIDPDGVSSRRSTTLGRLRRRLRGDLDAIAMRALRKEPDQRQPSAEALAEDVDRHLAYLPLRYGGGWSYGAGKFLRRYRVGAIAVTLFAIASGGFGSLYVTRIRAERDRAQREVAKTTEMTAALRRVFRGWSPDAADRGKVSAETLLGDAVRRARLELGGEPEVLAATLSMLGDMHSAVGQRATADSVLSQALAIQQRLPSVSSNDLAATLARRGWLLQESGRFAEAETSLRGALALYRALRGDERHEAIEAQHALGLVLRQRHEFTEAESLYREILRKLPPRQQLLRSEIAAELSYVYVLQARYREAAELVRPALALQRRLIGSVHKSTLRTMRYLASSLRGPQSLTEAEALVRESLDITRALYGEHHQETTSAKLGLAVLLERKGDFIAADTFARQATPSPLNSYFQAEDGALSLRTLGGIRLVLGDRAGAESALRRALTGVREVLPGSHPDEGDMLNRLAFLLLSRNAPDANTIYTQAVAFDQRRPNNGPYFVTDGYEYLGWAARRKGDLALAETLYRRAVTLYEKELPVGHPYRVQATVGLAEVLRALE